MDFYITHYGYPKFLVVIKRNMPDKVKLNSIHTLILLFAFFMISIISSISQVFHLKSLLKARIAERLFVLEIVTLNTEKDVK